MSDNSQRDADQSIGLSKSIRLINQITVKLKTKEGDGPRRSLTDLLTTWWSSVTLGLLRTLYLNWNND